MVFVGVCKANFFFEERCFQEAEPIISITQQQIKDHLVSCDNEHTIRDMADSLAFAAKETPQALKDQLQVTDDEIRLLHFCS